MISLFKLPHHPNGQNIQSSILSMTLSQIFQILASTLVLLLEITESKSPNESEKSTKKNRIIPPLDWILICLVMSSRGFCLTFHIYKSCEEYVHGSSDREFDNGIVLVLIGLLLCITGKYLRVRAKRELGKSFTYEIGVSKEQKLIQTGLYTHLMHPSYLAFNVTSVGICIMYNSLYFYILAVCLFGVLVYRIRIEEKMLQAHFGKEFEQYKSERWRMFPYIY